MSSSGSWPSGCPEKYPWIGGEERLPPWYEQERELYVQESSRHVPSGDENMPPVEEIPQEIPPAPEDPRIQQLEDIAMELTTRLYAAEATAERNGEELARVTALNEELIERIASLSTHAVRLWGQLVAARSCEDTQKWMFLVITSVALAALARTKASWYVTPS